MPRPTLLRVPQLPPSESVEPLPVIASTVSSHAAHALEAAEVALAGQESKAEGDDYGDKRPSEQLHVRPLPVGLR
jgi:hypothetical protein